MIGNKSPALINPSCVDRKNEGPFSEWALHPRSSRLLIKGNMSTVRIWPDDFRDGDYYITGFQERSQAGGLQPLIAVLRLFFNSGIPVLP